MIIFVVMSGIINNTHGVIVPFMITPEIITVCMSYLNTNMAALIKNPFRKTSEHNDI